MHPLEFKLHEIQKYFLSDSSRMDGGVVIPMVTAQLKHWYFFSSAVVSVCYNERRSI